MALTEQNVKNLIAGISQQPAVLRFPEQLENQQNAMSSSPTGLIKRPPTIHVAELEDFIIQETLPESGVNSNPLIHLIERDDNEKYLVSFNGYNIQVWDEKGNPKTVDFENTVAIDYLTTNNPREDLKAATVADYTFTSNAFVNTRMSEEVTSTQWDTQGVLFHVKSGQYGRTYECYINGVREARYTTPNGSDPADATKIDTNYIAEQLRTQLDAKGYICTSGEGWVYANRFSTPTTIVVHPSESASELYAKIENVLLPTVSTWWRYTSKRLEGNTVILQVPKAVFGGKNLQAVADKNIYKLIKDYWTYAKVDISLIDAEYRFTYADKTLTYPAGSAITSAATKDGFNNNAMFCFLKATQNFSNLPATAPDGFIVRVKGNNSTNSDDYYVKFDAIDNLWKETARPSIPKGFDKDTMPHALVRQANGIFIFKAVDWEDREVGDTDSNPEPSFIGNTIRDIFFVRNRLGFLSGENVIMSKSGEFFKYWMSTATDVLDSDTIDEAAPDESVTTLRHALVFNEELLVFSPRAQFIGHSDSVFSPKNFRLDRTTRFNCLPNCRPVSAGRRVYFANARSEFSSLMEYYIVEDVTGVKDAQDISNHVPEFIKNTVHSIIGNTSENLLLLLSSGAPNRIYVYKYLWQEERRAQASWSYWDFGSGEVLGGGFLGKDLLLVIKRGTKVYLEKMTFTYNTLDFPEEPYRAFMDRKTVYTVPVGAYNNLTGFTSINPQSIYPEELPEGVSYGIITQDGIYSEFPSDTTSVLFTGNLEGQALIVGELMEWSATLSELMIKEDDGKGGIKARNKGRLQVREVAFNYDRSGFFKVYVEHNGKQTFCYDMTARTLGETENTLGSLPIGTGTFTVPIQGNSKDVTITLKSSTPNAVSIIGYNWLGNYVERSGK